MSAVAITCRGVSKSFALIDGGNVWRVAAGSLGGIAAFSALEDVSFDVPKGQFAGFLGRNGAGKSTLLRVLGGVYAPDRGTVAVHGDLSGLYELGLTGHGELTGRQYAERLLTVHGFGKRERAEMIRDIHEFSELGDRFDDAVVTYSAGMSARLFFSTATAGQYEVYLLDEILSVGDQHFQAKCWRRIQQRIARGASGVLVTHDWSATIQICQTTHVIDHGKIIFSGPSERAARLYLYGDDAAPTYRTDIAHFGAKPPSPIRAVAGEDLRLSVDVHVLRAADVKISVVVESMKAGFGWETIFMNRRPQRVGITPGRYQVDIAIPALPLEPGSYQLSLQLGCPDPETEGVNVGLDSFGWLSGNGIAVEVESAPGRLFALPSSWSVSVP